MEFFYRSNKELAAVLKEVVKDGAARTVLSVRSLLHPLSRSLLWQSLFGNARSHSIEKVL